MNNFFQELKRRNVVRVGVAYLVVSWVILQFVDVILEIVTFPDWFSQMVLVLLIIGFPIALIVSWAFEVTPEGVKKTADVDKSKSVTHSTGQKLNKFIIGGLLIAIGFLLYERSMMPDEDVIGTASAGTISIAVLPFADLSPAGDQEYFSDGMTEEILNVLVKVPDLRVAGRTSSFAFKGRNENLTKIGEELNVDFLVEGSIRKSGNRLRITAQLIRAEDGFPLWSETYDREMTEIFAIQDEISRAIAGALSISLGIQDVNLVPNQTDDLVAYDDYLKALGLFKARGYEGLTKAIELLSTVTIRDPNFASGWELLAKVYSVYPYYIQDRKNEDWARNLALAELSANRALALNPNSADAYSALGSVFSERSHWQKSIENHQKAIGLDSNSGDIFQHYAEVLGMVGRKKEAAKIAARAVALEPLSAIVHNIYGYVLFDNGNFEKALAVAKNAFNLDPTLPFPVNNILLNYLILGRFEEAHGFAVFAQQRNPNISDDLVTLIEMIKDGANEDEVWDFVADKEDKFLDFIIIHAYQNSEVFLVGLEANNYDIFYFSNPSLMSPVNSFIWHDERYKLLVRRAGLYDYWKTTGNWADDCRPIGDDDFECTP